MNNKDASELSKMVLKMGNDRARLEHAVRTMLSRLGAEDHEITICVVEAKSGSFAWINKYLPMKQPIDHAEAVYFRAGFSQGYGAHIDDIDRIPELLERTRLALKNA